MDGMKTSAKLGVIAAVSAAAIGIVLGAAAALRRNKLIDKTIMVITSAFVSMPSFIMGSFLLIVFSVELRLLPANGSTSAGLILPIITLALYPMAYITRLIRSSMLDVLGQDYIRTARPRACRAATSYSATPSKTPDPCHHLLWPHAGLHPDRLHGGGADFAVPGLGRQFVSSITNRDYTMIMGTTIFLASLIVVLNLVSDILYKVVDPRIEFE